MRSHGRVRAEIPARRTSLLALLVLALVVPRLRRKNGPGAELFLVAQQEAVLEPFSSCLLKKKVARSRVAGVLEVWNSGILEFWNSGVLEFRSSRIFGIRRKP